MENTDKSETVIHQDFIKAVQQNLGNMATNHLEAWKDRYLTISLEGLQTDMYCNHDPSLEIEYIEGIINRKLISAEYDYLVREFNEAVINIRS